MVPGNSCLSTDLESQEYSQHYQTIWLNCSLAEVLILVVVMHDMELRVGLDGVHRVLAGSPVCVALLRPVFLTIHSDRGEAG